MNRHPHLLACIGALAAILATAEPSAAQDAQSRGQVAAVIDAVVAQRTVFLACAPLETQPGLRAADMARALAIDVQATKAEMERVGFSADYVGAAMARLAPDRLVNSFSDEAQRAKYCKDHGDWRDLALRLHYILPQYRVHDIAAAAATRAQIDALFDKVVEERSVLLNCSAGETDAAFSPENLRQAMAADVEQLRPVMKSGGLSADDTASLIERLNPDRLANAFPDKAELAKYCGDHAGWRERYFNMQITLPDLALKKILQSP